MEKIWANSADSHFLEPADLWSANAPASVAHLMPRSEKDPGGEWETVSIEGRSFRRRLPRGKLLEIRDASMRPPGARDPRLRLADLDREGVWAEVVFPSLGQWNASFRSPELLREATKVSNDWAHDTIMATSPRLLPTAQLPLLVVDDAVDELQRAASMGFVAAFMTVSPHPQAPDYNHDVWEPLWAAAEEAGMVLAIHVGSEPVDRLAGERPVCFAYSGPGATVMNYAETAFGGQRAAVKLVSCGALDRHPNLRVFIAEAGAGWVPYMADRMEESYRQHLHIRPTLSRSPREILYSQVYVSFQHDLSGVTTMTANGYRNVMWGSDYPHMEGTFGHTQETLHELFDDVDPSVRRRITVEAFQELFPSVAPAPIDDSGRLVAG